MTILTSISGVNTLSTNKSYTLTPFKTEHPLYFDEIGKIQYVHDEWRLLVYYNLSTYWEGTEKISEYVDHIERNCDTDQSSQVCGPLTAQLRHELDQFTQYNELLLTPHHVNRRKRGYFNGVGSLTRTLFGILDEDFAEKYEKDIEKVHTNEDYLLNLIKNQTTIIEAENSILRKNEEFMRQQFSAIKNFTREVNFTLSNIQSTLLSVMIMNDLNGAALTSSLLLSNLKRTQDILMNTLTNVNRGHLDTHLLTPQQLMKQLDIISARIPARLTLPIKDARSDLKQLYKLVYVKARITTQFLLYEIHIPLASDEDYTAYRIITLPIQRDGKNIIVNTQSPYLAINFRKSRYLHQLGGRRSKPVHKSRRRQLHLFKHSSYIQP